jgi:hypothetical protein
MFFSGSTDPYGRLHFVDLFCAVPAPYKDRSIFVMILVLRHEKTPNLTNCVENLLSQEEVGVRNLSRAPWSPLAINLLFREGVGGYE